MGCNRFPGRALIELFGVPVPERQTGLIPLHFVGCLVYRRLPYAVNGVSAVPTQGKRACHRVALGTDSI